MKFNTFSVKNKKNFYITLLASSFITFLVVTALYKPMTQSQKNFQELCGENRLRQRTVGINGYLLYSDISCTFDEKELGLMYKSKLPENYAMVFVFDEPQQLNFWMKNTFVPLSIAYINENRQIVGMADMEPHDLNITSSPGKVSFAIEAKKGWFMERGIQVGDTVNF